MCGVRASNACTAGRTLRPFETSGITGSGSTSPLEPIPGRQLVPPESHGDGSRGRALVDLAQRLDTNIDLDSAPLARRNPRDPPIERG
jgi:hypothetical protein